MARVPPDRVAALAGLAEDIPDCFTLSAGAGDRPKTGSVRSRLDESKDAVLRGALPRGDAGPEDRREYRLERENISRDTSLHDSLEVGHAAGVHQRMDHLPVSSIPADEQELLCERRSHPRRSV